MMLLLAECYAVVGTPVGSVLLYSRSMGENNTLGEDGKVDCSLRFSPDTVTRRGQRRLT